MADMTSADFAAAKARGDARLRGPRAESAHYDAGRNRIIVRLTTGVELGLAPGDVEGLRGATIADLKEIEVEAFGLGIHFPRLDADLYVPALLQAVVGTRRWMAAQLGAEGGRARSVAKAAAARANGKRGGRPRRVADGGQE
ncbi:MAG: DUF2442 domain-containing protein [Proteobacteria bacterium]|nr:DUF2442 domain-containing protein [Pseudomonadota bacterium]